MKQACKAISASVLTVALLCGLLLTACTTNSKITNSDSTTPYTTLGTTPAYATPVAVQYYSDENTNEEDHVQYMDEKIASPAETIIFTTTQNVANFKYLEIQFNVETQKYEVVEELFLQAEFTPEKPILIMTVVSETLADRGYCFEDEDGTVRYFSLAYDANGENNVGGILSSQFSIQSP